MKEAGFDYVRGGAFKPRTSPYSFQGLGEEGLKILSEVSGDLGLKVVTEVMDPYDIEMVMEHAQILQIGARNMANFSLLRRVGAAIAGTDHGVVLKRGLSATVEEWLLAAEYVTAAGGDNVVLCERGIRTFETSTRFTLDLSAVIVAKRLTDLPVIVDPSHAAGTARSRRAALQGRGRGRGRRPDGGEPPRAAGGALRRGAGASGRGAYGHERRSATLRQRHG